MDQERCTRSSLTYLSDKICFAVYSVHVSGSAAAIECIDFIQFLSPFLMIFKMHECLRGLNVTSNIIKHGYPNRGGRVMSNHPFEEFKLDAEELARAKKASAEIHKGLRTIAEIVQKHTPTLSTGPEKVTIEFDPTAGIQQFDGQTHSGGPGPCYVYRDPPGICRPCTPAER